MIIRTQNHMFTLKRIFAALVAVPICLGVLSIGNGQVNAQDAIPQVVTSGLSNPSGVAIQPETGHVFVADSGAGRVVRVIDGKIQAVITDFPTENSSTDPAYKIGPLGLLFLNKDTLVVGGGGLPSGEDSLSVFEVPGVGEGSINASATFGKSHSLPTIGKDDDEKSGLGNFYGLTAGSAGIFVTCDGGDRGWVSLATVKENQITKFTRKIATKDFTDTDSPVAATTSPDGYIVIGQMGDTKNVPDSLLTFYSQGGPKLGVYRTGLNDITGLAYGPRHGRLFALDYNFANPNQGGLFKLVDMKNETQCESVLMSKLEKPTALAFTLTGDCYITLAGLAKPANGKPDGKLILIRQLDIDPNK